ncbi:MAG: VWA domain-containing protein, partial [Terriglobales bacterium]
VAVAPAGAPPRLLALFFDDVETSDTDLGHARIAAQRFGRDALAPSDQVALFTNSGLQALPFTRDRTRLEAALAALRAHPRATNYSDGCLRISAYQAYLIVNHLDPLALSAAMANKGECDRRQGLVPDDAMGRSAMPGMDESSEVVMAIAENIWDENRAAALDTFHALGEVMDALAAQSGTRVLVLASGGFLAGTIENQQDELVRQALREKITINSLDAKGLYTEGPGIPLTEQSDLGIVPKEMYSFLEESKMTEGEEREAAMANLALSTGGLLFHNNNDLELGFRRLGLAPEVAYELAFTPAGIAHDGKFHRLKVEVAPDHNYTVQARRGYFAPPPDTPASLLPDALDAAMRASGAEAGLQAAVSYRDLGASKPERAQIRMHLQLRGLPFAKSQGRQRERLVFTAMLTDAHGVYVSGKQAEMDLSLQEATFRKLEASGLNADLSLAAKSGSYTLRCVIAEANAGKLFAATVPVTLR